MSAVAEGREGPGGERDDLGYLHLQLFSIQRDADKLKYLAGSESEMGAFITGVLPKNVARRLREV